MDWKEITQVNVETIKELNRRGHPVVIAVKSCNRCVRYSLKQKELSEYLDKYAKRGGIYYMVLPKLY